MINTITYAECNKEHVENISTNTSWNRPNVPKMSYANEPFKIRLIIILCTHIFSLGNVFMVYVVISWYFLPSVDELYINKHWTIPNKIPV